MNDFTKEELQIILLDMNVYINRTTILAESPSHKSLRNKVESMIDNYCEHESDGYDYYKTGRKCTDFLLYVSSESPSLLKCKKCSELFDNAGK